MSDNLYETLSLVLERRTRVLERHARLFAQGAPVEHLYFVHRGRIKLVRDTIEGTPVVQHVALSGEALAEASLFADNYHCSAIADLPTELDYFRKAELLAALEQRPALMKKLLTQLARQVRELRALNELKNIRSARERILAYLRNQADAAGRVALPLSLKETAYRIGLAHETLYRELTRMELSGLLCREPGRIRLL